MDYKIQREGRTKTVWDHEHLGGHQSAPRPGDKSFPVGWWWIPWRRFRTAPSLSDLSISGKPLAKQGKGQNKGLIFIGHLYRVKNISAIGCIPKTDGARQSAFTAPANYEAAGFQVAGLKC